VTHSALHKIVDDKKTNHLGVVSLNMNVLRIAGIKYMTDV